MKKPQGDPQQKPMFDAYTLAALEPPEPVKPVAPPDPRQLTLTPQRSNYP